MSFPRLIPAFVMVGLVAGCATPQGTARQASGDSNAGTAADAPVDTRASYASPSVGPASNTIVGQKARELERDTDRLEQATADHTSAHSGITAGRAQLSSEYFTQVAQINSRLEAGTTPGNPELVAEWQSARTALNGLDGAAAQLTDISTKFTDDTAQATYLAQSIRAAFTLRGAVDADHAALRRLAGRVASAGATLEQTLGTVLDELNRQNEMLAVEHRNLITLSRAIEVGQLLGNNLGITAGPLPSWTTQLPPAPPRTGAPTRLHRSGVPLGKPAAGEHPSKRHGTGHRKPATMHNGGTLLTPLDPTAAPPTVTDAPEGAPSAKPQRHPRHGGHPRYVTPISIKGRPLIVIPVATGDDSYQRQLYTAVSGALETAPSVKFLVVAAAPGNHSRGQAVLDAAKAQHQADDIVRSLVAFGLPQNRVQTVSTTAPADSVGEIKVFAKR
jgi:hypothetical protein